MMSGIMLNVIMLKIIMLNAVMLGGIILSVRHIREDGLEKVLYPLRYAMSPHM